MLLLSLLINFSLFLIMIFLIIYLPGLLFLSKVIKDLNEEETISLSLSIGIVFFVLLGVVLGIIHLRFLSLPIVYILGFITLIKFKKSVFYPWRGLLKSKFLLGLILLGILVQGFINFPSGFKYNEGLLFWSSQGHDGLWHVSLMEEIKKQFPPQNPIFAGQPLVNYHYLVDVLMGEFARIFPFFSSLDLYFRFFPVLFSFLMGVTIFAFLTRWQNKKTVGYLGLFFLYFTGSFGYIVNFIKGVSILGGETVFWAAQQNTILGNPPHAFSHILIPAFFLSFLIYLQTKLRKWLVISFILGSVLAGFKVSGGLVLLTGVGAAALVDLLFNRNILTLILAILLSVSNFVTFKSMTSANAVSFLMFLPWWFIRTMVVVKLGWMDLELRREFYLAKGTWNAMLRVLEYEGIAFTIFIVGNLGMRILGFIALGKNFSTKKISLLKDPLEAMLIVSMLTGLIMPILFVQKGIIYNNIQFMQYFLLIFGFYAALSVDRILSFFKKKSVKILIMITITLLSVPTVLGNLVEFYGPNTSALSKITNSELMALNFLKDNSDKKSVVLNMAFKPDLKNNFLVQPRPIYAWYSTPYISAISLRRSYLAAEEQVLITGYPLDERLANVKKFFIQEDFNWNKDFLRKVDISYIYIAKNEITKPLDINKNDLSPFFENDEVIIYKVNR